MALSPTEIDAILKREADHQCPGVGDKRICVKIVAIAELPTRFGRFQIAAFWNNRDSKEHVAIMHGDVRDAQPSPLAAAPRPYTSGSACSASDPATRYSARR